MMQYSVLLVCLSHCSREVLFRYHTSHSVLSPLLYRLDCASEFYYSRDPLNVIMSGAFFQCFITKYLDEACFSVTDKGKEDCL